MADHLWDADRVHVVQSVMEDLAVETSTESSSARQAGRRTEIPEPSILYPYRIQVLRQFLPADTDAIWALAQMERNAQW